MTPNQLVFLFMATIAALGAVGVVLLHSPVRAALALVANFFCLGLMYFMLGSQMLGISQIMVYAGAIMVLFLFVVMILRSSQDSSADKPQLKEGRFMIVAILALGLFALLASQVAFPALQQSGQVFDRTYGTPQAIGKVLFTDFVWPFEIVSILLLVGIVGSIMLAKRRF